MQHCACRYLLIGAYVGVVTVTAYAWWFLHATAGPRMVWGDLVRSQACDDATRTHAFPCAVFADLRPSTMAMSVLVVVEMFNALNALSENRSLAAVPPWRNPLLLAAIAISMALHFAILCASPRPQASAACMGAVRFASAEHQGFCAMQIHAVAGHHLRRHGAVVG